MRIGRTDAKRGGLGKQKKRHGTRQEIAAKDRDFGAAANRSGLGALEADRQRILGRADRAKPTPRHATSIVGKAGNTVYNFIKTVLVTT